MSNCLQYGSVDCVSRRAFVQGIVIIVAIAWLAGSAFAQVGDPRGASSSFQLPSWVDQPPAPPFVSMLQDDVDDVLDLFDEPAPENDPGEAETGSEADEAATESEEDDSPTEDDDGDRRLGEAPEDTSQLFLRGATVLLKPGEMQFDHGLTYSLVEVATPIFLSDGSLSTERLRTRQWVVPYSFRFGIKEKVQGFVDVPFGYSLVERADREFDEFTNVFGIGDVSGGVSVLLRREKDDCPDVIGTLSLSIPTGDDPFGIGANDPALGIGFWGVSASVSAVKSYDPAVLFGSVGYAHFFSRSFFGNNIQLGELVSYAFGMGWAVNNDVTMSTALIGSYQFDTSVNGVRSPRTSSEPIALRMAVTGSMFKCHIVEPFVRLGLTDSAADVNFGVIITRL